jgi:type II secretory pathway pseudopilin PulG
MRARQGGFTYVGLIVMVTIVGLVGAATLKVESLIRRAEAEEELLEVGAEFTRALKSYAQATPRGQPQQPPSLKELLRDPRFREPRRHLRKIYIDPITGKDQWGIIYLSGDKGVIGVHSLSDTKPLKIGNFDSRFQGFDNADLISDWRFTTSGQSALPGERREPKPPLVDPPAGRDPIPQRPDVPLGPPGASPPAREGDEDDNRPADERPQPPRPSPQN